MNTEEKEFKKDSHFEEALTPKRTRLQEFWLLFRQNRLAILGLCIFILFFFSALIGLILTSGTGPLFDPALIRLQEKLRPPLSEPNLETLRPEEVPKLGLYLMGTDDLGRDVFARMLQGAWVSLTVGFVAVGISVLIGIFMGGIAGYYGQYHIRGDHILVTGFFVSGVVLIFTDLILPGTILFLFAFALIYYPRMTKNTPRDNLLPAWAGLTHQTGRLFFPDLKTYTVHGTSEFIVTSEVNL